jgi:pilus assembly protein CpaE
MGTAALSSRMTAHMAAKMANSGITDSDMAGSDNMDVAAKGDALEIPQPSPNQTACILDLTQSVDPAMVELAPEDDAQTKGKNSFQKIIGLMGVSGGVGTTSLAIQMAYDIIKQGGKKGPSVALIDLDFESGACAAYLDLKAGLSHEDLQGDPERIDIALTAAFIRRHKTGIHVLAADNKLGGNDSVNPDVVLALLDTMCDMFDVIILDLPRIWRPWNHAAIGAADHFALISELSIPGIHKTRHRIDSIERIVTSMPTQTEVIISKMERRTFTNEIRIQDAVKILGRPLSGAICIDTEATLSALNRGIPTGLIRMDGRYVKDTRNVLDFWKSGEQNFAKHVVK